MIISASRRTDIPAYYSKWFFQRLKEGYVLVRSPKNPSKVSRISLAPQDVEGIVFWTKCPLPMIPKLSLLERYMYYFQVTLNAYKADVQPNIPDAYHVLVPAFRRLAHQIGNNRVIWRYDPIFFTPTYTPEWHINNFEKLAGLLRGCTQRCTISFLDDYRNIASRMKAVKPQNISSQTQIWLADQLAEIARRNDMELFACAESGLQQACGIRPASCIDGKLFSDLLGYPMLAPKDSSQRKGCHCMESIDIGAYDTCPGGCLYCYANGSKAVVYKNVRMHQAHAPLLTGTLTPQDTVITGKPKMYGQLQLSFETEK